MKLQFFTVPAKFPEEIQQRINAYCTQHWVLTIDKQFVNLGNESYWSICVAVMEGNNQGAVKPISDKREQIDYKEILGERDFALYVQLRNLRKTLSEQEGIPAYALFTNEQLAKMVTQRVISLAELTQIEGVGKARLEKYGRVFVDVLLTAQEENVTRNDTPVDNEARKN